MTSYKGKFLAAQAMGEDDPFEGSAVLVLEDDEHGSFGLVVNKPGVVDEAMLFSMLGLDFPVAGQFEAGWGGPVTPGRVCVLHSAEHVFESTGMRCGKVAVTFSPDVLEAISEGREPQQALAVAGCSGWDAGQLQGEIDRGAWLVVEADAADILFLTPRAARWDKLVALAGVPREAMRTAFFVAQAGHA
ncbi:MAG: YqgE/AlgH family protein [Duodenibacillus sp.]|nr:YqgE/AlgH family protein [Duodenibacillus sp.]